jgi:signal recognition particle receptor subunit beta
MPRIDDSRGVLVVRIVYDGPAMSGKTTSLRSLSRSLGVQMVTPEEREGRTLYFDWVDYVGGIFEGRPIRCQMVSVPGQKELRERRQQLIAAADAVVVVVDSRRRELARGMNWLREAIEHLQLQTPPVGVVLQANKRDAKSAVPREELRRELNRIAPIALVESVATKADGIREAFVVAVRLALDRVRALGGEPHLDVGQPDENDALDLLAKLRAIPQPAATLETRASLGEDEGPRSEIQHLLRDSTQRDGGARDEILFAPDPSIPSGMIWPPVEGRTFLHELAALSLRPLRTRRGDWWASGFGWRFHSNAHAVYEDHETARLELLAWARLHAAAGRQMSPGRVVSLADAGRGRLRLWQLVRVEPALRERLEATLASEDVETVAQGLVEVVRRLGAAREWFGEAQLELPCTLWTIGDADPSRPLYVGLMPRDTSSLSVEPTGPRLVERELAPHLRELRRSHANAGQLYARLTALTAVGTSESVAWLAELAGKISEEPAAL